MQKKNGLPTSRVIYPSDKLSEQFIKESECTATKTFDTESYRILAELSQAIMFEWEIVNDHISVSDNWSLVFGNKPPIGNFSGNIDRIFSIDPKTKNVFTEYVNRTKKIKKVGPQHYEKFELHLLTKNNEYIWFQVRLLLRCDENESPERVFGMMTDINMQKKEYESLLHEARHDVLTNLYNKATTQRLIAHYLRHSRLKDKRQVLFVIDIDNFKDINDLFGHLFGDSVIVDIAHSIKLVFNKTDIVGRIGGDEFMALCKNCSEDLFIRKSHELLAALSKTYTHQARSIKISASIGAVISPDYGTRFEDLFRKADKALYYIKASGKNNYCLYDNDLSVPQYVNKREFLLTGNSEKNKKFFHENVVEYIFKILHRSTDATAATNLILEIISNRYKISRAFIIEKNSDGNYSNTFEWCSDKSASKKSSHQDIPKGTAEKFFSCLNEDGIFGCADVKLLPAEMQIHFKDSDIHAILECAVFSEGNIRAMIGFEYHTHPREWKSEEIESLSFTAEILGTFLIQKRTLDKMKHSHMQTLEILDHIESFIYVIDTQNYEILFLNKSAAEFFGTKQLGKKCYNIIAGEEAPCSFCPIKLLDESTDSAQKVIYLEKRDLWLRAAISKIHWSADREVCMVHCHDITALKKKK
ncbi:diguanylate cyclase domain-containing protein [Pectinatus haikarae]|uniref:Diguanylate cyclase (GGDEF)-like protein n=1 Tax=Pectinatus haikarae TaxID=349096 RepID=A0ABT9Y559_9FIRM|nr:diguanylate cyclase [Pectinatus haikarae]MDQ0202969.1 diguanylate cyclase (GGDEF)-like protein [Pectinatus haikarae]